MYHYIYILKYIFYYIIFYIKNKYLIEILKLSHNIYDDYLVEKWELKYGKIRYKYIYLENRDESK